MDLSNLSDQDLIALHQQYSQRAVKGIESSGAPDSSTIVNPKSGAFGSMQVVPATGTDPGFGVRPSDGTPEDTARMGRDYLAALQQHFSDDTIGAAAYNWGPGNVQKWLEHGGDISKVPDETLKYMYKYNQTMGKTDAVPPKSSASPDLSKMSDEDLKALYKQLHPELGLSKNQSNSKLDFIDQAKQTTLGGIEQAPEAAKGIGETGANMLTSIPETLADLGREGYNVATGQDKDTGIAGMHSFFNPIEYEPKTEAGKKESAGASKVMSAITDALNKGGMAAAGAVPFVGEDLEKSPTTKNVVGFLSDVVANVAPMMLGAEGVKGIAKGKGIKDPAVAAELDKLNALHEQNGAPETPTTPPPAMGPNEGPQRPPITVDSAGNATAPWNPPEPGNVAGQMAQEAAERKAQWDSGDLFPQTMNGEGAASPFDPNRLAGEEAPAARGMLSDRRQGELQLDNNEPIRVSPEGEAFPESQTANRDTMQARAESVQWQPPETMDPSSGVPHPNEGVPADRAATPPEFAKAIQTLVDREPDKYSMPADLSKAYEHYLNVVSGDMEPKGIAGRFVEAVRNQMAEDRVNNHPTIKSNQARVDRLQAQLEAAQGRSAPTSILKKQLDTATKTLEKSKENIGKALGAGKEGILPWEKDGVVNLHTFGSIPEIFKSIGALLKGLHGVVFRTLDRLPRQFGNLDSTGKIFGQGFRDFVAEQANKKWDTQVNEKPKATLKGVPGLREGLKDYLPFDAREDLKPEDLKKAMQDAPDLTADKDAFRSFMRNNFLTGQQIQAFTHHPLVKFATETVDRAMRNSAKFVREQLTGKDGLRNMVRELSDNEFSTIWHAMQEAEGKVEYTADQLKRAGFNDKQIKMYLKMRELDKAGLDALNRGRETAGLKPVDARIAHIAGHFLGDFKRVITDKDGKVVAVIAHNFKPAVNIITKRVMEQLGEGHTAGPIEMRKMSEGMHNTDRYTGYMNILNDMAGRDDVMKAVMDAYKDYLVSDGQAAMKYRAAFKQKEGVIGAEGRQSWVSASENAKRGMETFLKAQESMNTWANMQDALHKISQFQKDPEIDAPNAKAATQKYLDNVQRRDQGPLASAANGLINGVSNLTGVGPSVLRHTSNGAKEALLTWFIGIGKLSHSFVTMVQPLQGIPVVSSLMRGEGAKLPLFSLSATAKSFGSMTKFAESLASGKELTGFEKRAMDFARDNDTLNTTQFQFGNLTDINPNGLGRTMAKAAEFNVTGMETGTRAFTFMYYAHMLRDLSKGEMSEKEIFSTAHNAMRDVMVDYNSWERPGIFGKLGFVGDLTAMLTRYKMNQIDQFMRAGKYAKEGNLTPMITVMTSAIAAAGVRGVMMYGIANALVAGLSTAAASAGVIQKPTSIDEMLLAMLHGHDQNWTDLVKFGLPAKLGLNMTGSLSHADDIPFDPFNAILPQAEPFAQYAKGLYDFARDPNKATFKNALYQLSPNSLRGMEENTMFTDKNGRYENPATGETQTVRTPSEQIIRNGGFRPLNEARDSLTATTAKGEAAQEWVTKQAIIHRVLRDIDSHGKAVTPELQDQIKQKYVKAYLANSGDPTDIDKAIVEHLGIGQARTAAQRAQGIPNQSLQSALDYMRYEKLK